MICDKAVIHAFEFQGQQLWLLTLKFVLLNIYTTIASKTILQKPKFLAPVVFKSFHMITLCNNLIQNLSIMVVDLENYFFKYLRKYGR